MTLKNNYQSERAGADGSMVRRLSGEIRDSLRNEIFDQYRDKNGKLPSDSYRESCAEWHWKVVLYIPKEERDIFVDYITTAFENKEKLDEDPIWRLQMRRKLPSHAFDKIWDGSFTQLPKLSLYNQTPLRKKQKEGKEMGIFSMPIREKQRQKKEKKG